MTVLAIFAVNSVFAVFAFDDAYIDINIAVGIFYVQHSVFYLDIGNTAAIVAVFAVFAFKRRYPLLQSALKAGAFYRQLIGRLAVFAVFAAQQFDPFLQSAVISFFQRNFV